LEEVAETVGGRSRRYCEKALAKVVAVAEDGGGTAHERYLNLWKLLRKTDPKLAAVFDNPRRSVA
jgi:hypothetical protein